MKKRTRMPWEMPDLADISATDMDRERRQAANGPVVEGGCWFSHVGGIDVMEKDYARRSREGRCYTPPAPGINL